MSATIKTTNLSKRYWLRHESRTRHRSTTEEFWALKDVSFEVQPGEVVGIIGSNGAGKSTLLKILSRITEPTSGRVEIEGRVASLLEVGTGFHPELTGRENIFLNGAILGMTRAEIRARFDEIVAFAEVDKFLDTPVKRYSSGMYVRLAFAVAAHLEPEILVVDEVLAVGDAQFQKKCLGKMRAVSANEGRTVLFVSHHMGTVRQLCSRCILLAAGQIIKTGSTPDVIDGYLNMHLGGRGAGFTANASAKSTDIAIERAWISNKSNEPTPYFVHTEPITINVSCRVNRWVSNAELRLSIDDSRGRRVFTSDAILPNPGHAEQGLIEAQARVPESFLRPETYLVTISTLVRHQVVIDIAREALSFVVQDGGSKYAASEGTDYGCVFAPCDWTVSYDDSANETDAAS